MIRPKHIRKSVTPTVPWRTCLAKSREDPPSPGRTVLDHCEIVGRIAEAIAQTYPKKIRDDLFCGKVGLLASCHDVGKITPVFQEKLKAAISGEPAPITTSNEGLYQYHGGATYLALKAMGVPETVAWAEGSHHRPLLRDALATVGAEGESLGGKPWQEQRESFVKFLESEFGKQFPEKMEDWRARVIGGLTQQADWLGSGELFDDPGKDWKPLVQKAVSDAGYRAFSVRAGLSFEDVFGFPPREAQLKLIEAVTGPGVYVLEAPMGIGKTEAALFAAYRMMEAGDASGLYFALPTCLTSQKIHERVEKFLKAVGGSDAHSFLVTSAARFEAGGDFSAGGPWFSGYHRRILARFGVGTIDQALIAAMLTRRSMAALSGLAGKVVILDEVHSYDVYTRVFLEILVEHLRSLHCTVIILSATLTLESRARLLFAPKEKRVPLSPAYPLITACPAAGNTREVSVPVASSAEVGFSLVNDEPKCFDEAIRRAEEGEQVLWIENTVRDAQEIYSVLRARLPGTGIEVGLLHSRFLPAHRAALEDKWVSLYGPRGWEERKKCGRILIGTQVLEQSLDIDSDFLITRLAPIDLILQRLGRLWRHSGTPRPAGSAREAWILVPEADNAENPGKKFLGTFLVYYPYVLLRTLEALKSLSGTIKLPMDMRRLIEGVYRERDEEGLLALAKNEMLNGSKAKGKRGVILERAQARIDAATPGHSEARLSDPDLTILLLRDIRKIKEERKTVVVTMEGKEIELPWDVSQGSRRGKAAALLDRELLHIRIDHRIAATSWEMLDAFHLDDYVYCGTKEEPAPIWVATVGEDGELRPIGENSPSELYSYRYGQNGCFGLMRKNKNRRRVNKISAILLARNYLARC